MTERDRCWRRLFPRSDHAKPIAPTPNSGIAQAIVVRSAKYPAVKEHPEKAALLYAEFPAT